MQTLLQELGGREAVEMVVAAFYERVMTDPLLAKYFRGVQMSRLYKNQADFFCAALGEPDAYRGRDMRSLHAGMNIGDAEFDAVAVHLSNALADCGGGQVGGALDRSARRDRGGAGGARRRDLEVRRMTAARRRRRYTPRQRSSCGGSGSSNSMPTIKTPCSAFT
jgi:hemoglobin